MRVEAFIPDWPGDKQHAAEIANQIARFYPTRILDNPNDYFNAQWDRARNLFTGDVLLWAMADITLPSNHAAMFQEMERLMATDQIGWYAPNVDWTGFMFDKNTLTKFEPDIYEVPNTDSVFFAIRADVIKEMPRIDPKKCFMWGMDFTAILTAHRMGYKIVRDYRFLVRHPNNTGYNVEDASKGMRWLFEGDTYDADFKEHMQGWIERTNQLKRKRPS